MDNQTLHLAKKHRDYWIGRAQELQSNPHQLADEILEFTQQEVKNCSIPDVVWRSEQLPNMTLEQVIAKAKPNLDKITNVDKHLDDIR